MRLVGLDLADLGTVVAGGIVAQVEPDIDERPGSGCRDDVLPHAQDLGVVVLHRAASRSCAVAARTPGTLLAAMAVPTPVPQMRTPRSARPSATALATRKETSG